MAKYISCADTAKLVRQALKEAFPGVKFSVRSSTYAGGASMRVNWMDGPSSAQVESVTNHFEGSYFDGSIDYKGSVSHMLNGEAVRFGADSIHCNRDFSDVAVQRAIDRVCRRFAGNLKDAGIEAPTVPQYNRGEFWRIRFFENGGDNLQQLVSRALYKHSDRLKIEKSKTVASCFVTHDDGYSRSCGAGVSAVAVAE